MDEKSQALLINAYHLIQSGAFADAGPLITAVLKVYPENSDAWWLLAYTVPSPQKKRLALHQVLKLNPDHAAARLLLNRLEPLSRKTTEVDLKAAAARPRLKPPKKKLKWGFVLVMVFACLASMSVPLVVLDNLTGGQMLKPLERALLGEPEPYGWVHKTYGGQADDDISRRDRIAITKQGFMKYGDLQLGVLALNEAHRYRFNARHGDELVIAAAFTSQGNTDVIALELWDASGQVVARDFQDEGFQLGILFGARALQYKVIHEGLYSLVLVSRTNGPTGSYSLYVDTIDHMLDNPPDLSGLIR